MQLPTDYFVQALPHANLNDLIQFLTNPVLGGSLSQIIRAQPPKTRFVLVDGMNIINSPGFLRSIVDNREDFYLFQQIYTRCLQRLPRFELSEFIEGQIEALPRKIKINLIRCLTLTLTPELYGDLHLIVITGTEGKQSNMTQVTPHLTWINIGGHRIEGNLEVDDLLLAFLVYYLAIQERRPTLIWSRDQYAFMEAIAPDWPKIRQTLNGVLFETSDSPTGKWDFIPVRTHRLMDFRARSGTYGSHWNEPEPVPETKPALEPMTVTEPATEARTDVMEV
jgi:hypothetical protein